MNQEEITELLTITESCINELVKDFDTHPDIFLTEDDIRAQLVSKLLRNTIFSKPRATMREGVNSIPVHCEVRWYGEGERDERFRSDIVILDPSSLETVDPIRTKGYAFNSFHAVIELKLRRRVGCSDNEYKSLIEADYYRMLSMISNRQSVSKYYLICFDKKSDISDRLNEINDNRIDFKYKSKIS